MDKLLKYLSTFCRKRVGSQSEGLSESERAEKGELAAWRDAGAGRKWELAVDEAQGLAARRRRNWPSGACRRTKTGRGWPRGETQSWPRAKEQGEELDGGAGLGAGEVA